MPRPGFAGGVFLLKGYPLTAIPTTVLASAARTVTGQSTAFGTAMSGQLDDRFVNVHVNVTAASGTTPTLDVKLQWSNDAGASWMDADPGDSFTQITAVKAFAKAFQVKGQVFRVVYTIAGATPSFTFAVTATSA